MPHRLITRTNLSICLAFLAVVALWLFSRESRADHDQADTPQAIASPKPLKKWTVRLEVARGDDPDGDSELSVLDSAGTFLRSTLHRGGDPETKYHITVPFPANLSSLEAALRDPALLEQAGKPSHGVVTMTFQVDGVDYRVACDDGEFRGPAGRLQKAFYSTMRRQDESPAAGKMWAVWLQQAAPAGVDTAWAYRIFKVESNGSVVVDYVEKGPRARGYQVPLDRSSSAKGLATLRHAVEVASELPLPADEKANVSFKLRVLAPWGQPVCWVSEEDDFEGIAAVVREAFDKTLPGPSVLALPWAPSQR